MIIASNTLRVGSLLLPAGALGAILCLGACGSSDESTDETTVVATTTHLADIAREVGGDDAEVVGILPANADPHDYEPKPSDSEALIEADLVLRSGGDVDAWAEELIESSGTDAETLVLLDHVRVAEGGAGHAEEHAEGEEGHGHEHDEDDVDPHWWQDPLNGARAAEEIAAELAGADADHADEFRARASSFAGRARKLDKEIAACIAQVSESDRKVVTSHDSLGYFVDRYGIELVGAAVPALTTQAQPSAGEVANLVDLIEEEGVKAVFPEAGLDSDLEQAIADDAGATVGNALHADALGGPGSGGETYLSSLASNATAITAGMSGGDVACAPGVE